MSLDVFENLEKKIHQALMTIHELKKAQKESPQEKVALSGAHKQLIRQKIQEIIRWIDEYSDESNRGEKDQ